MISHVWTLFGGIKWLFQLANKMLKVRNNKDKKLMHTNYNTKDTIEKRGYKIHIDIGHLIAKIMFLI